MTMNSAETWEPTHLREVGCESIVGLQEAKYLFPKREEVEDDGAVKKKRRFCSKPVEEILPGHTLVGGCECEAALLFPDSFVPRLRWRSRP